MRPVLIHPMLVHFSIALLLTGVVVRLTTFFEAPNPRLSFLLPASWMICLIAACPSIIADEFAQEIVEPSLKNVSVLDEHQEHANITAFGFTLGLFIEWARVFLIGNLIKKSWIVKRGLVVVVWFASLFRLTNLIITGFYGGGRCGCAKNS